MLSSIHSHLMSAASPKKRFEPLDKADSKQSNSKKQDSKAPSLAGKRLAVRVSNDVIHRFCHSRLEGANKVNDSTEEDTKGLIKSLKFLARMEPSQIFITPKESLSGDFEYEMRRHLARWLSEEEESSTNFDCGYSNEFKEFDFVIDYNCFLNPNQKFDSNWMCLGSWSKEFEAFKGLSKQGETLGNYFRSTILGRKFLAFEI